MLSTEHKIRRGFHWLAVFLAAILLAIGLVSMTFDVGDLRHPGQEDITTSTGDLFLGAVGLFFACLALWAVVRAFGWGVIRLYRRYENQQRPHSRTATGFRPRKPPSKRPGSCQSWGLDSVSRERPG